MKWLFVGDFGTIVLLNHLFYVVASSRKKEHLSNHPLVNDGDAVSVCCLAVLLSIRLDVKLVGKN